ncbi:MAG: hypothetical protein HY940_01460 [Gammaproteobacteria bacterium]|nr:hypothetical protein [Gammaproteobacteria bacterium]
MKTDPTNFGFEILVTFLLPGILGAVAAGIFHGMTESQLKEMLDWATNAQFITSFFSLAAVALLGAIIASIQAVIETCILDRITPWCMGIDKEIFNSDWNYYVDNLQRLKNPYVSRVVLFFQFETRLGLSAIILGMALLKLSCSHATLAFALGLGFYIIGMMHHKELAGFRNRTRSAASHTLKSDLGDAMRPSAP